MAIDGDVFRRQRRNPRGFRGPIETGRHRVPIQVIRHVAIRADFAALLRLGWQSTVMSSGVSVAIRADFAALLRPAPRWRSRTRQDQSQSARISRPY